MSELLKTQTCPYCGNEVDDSCANWEAEKEEVECDMCRKKYTVEAVYEFLGFEVLKHCSNCDMPVDDCYCEEDIGPTEST